MDSGEYYHSRLTSSLKAVELGRFDMSFCQEYQQGNSRYVRVMV